MDLSLLLSQIFYMLILWKKCLVFSEWLKMEQPRVLYRIFRETLNIQQSQNNLAGVKTGGFPLTLV